MNLRASDLLAFTPSPPPFAVERSWLCVCACVCNFFQALMGLNCPEIHVCGGLEAAKLVELLCEKVQNAVDEF